MVPLSASTPDATQMSALYAAAAAVAANAYAPYSQFRVGAALLVAPSSRDVSVVAGCNVENASFRLTTCAEQAAVAAAVARYGPEIRILAVAVTNLNETACPPCGACLQTLLEFSLPETVILFPAVTHPGEAPTMQQRQLSELIPAGFRLEPT